MKHRVEMISFELSYEAFDSEIILSIRIEKSLFLPSFDLERKNIDRPLFLTRPLGFIKRSSVVAIYLVFRAGGRGSIPTRCCDSLGK